LINPDCNAIEREAALIVVNNWRAAHHFPLNTFQTSLRRKSVEVNKSAVVAQRIKRLPAIDLKLRLIPGLRLAQMQDIGGCRVVVNSVRSVNRLVQSYRDSAIKHELVHADNYINEPRSSGYRGIHLIYRYHSDKNTDFNTLKLEMQVRTRLQHAWATAVETVGTFKQQALKSGLGDGQWLRFFALMGSIIAIREKSPVVPGTPDNLPDLRDELRTFVEDLDVISHLNGYQVLLYHLPLGTFKGFRYFLLELQPGTGMLHITPYQRQQVGAASRGYLESERQARFNIVEERDSVLVSVDSMKALRVAYPNYFADTRRFIREVERAVN